MTIETAPNAAAAKASLPLPPAPHDPHWPKRLPRRITVPETTLAYNLEVAAARYPDKAATIFFGQRYTWRAMQRDVEALAGWLQGRGIARGDRVGIFLPNCPQYLVATYAILRADAVVVPLNPMLKADEIAHIVGDSGCKAIITTADLGVLAAQAQAELPEAQRLRDVLLVRLGDALGTDTPADERPPGPVWDWLNATPPDPRVEGAALTRWRDALAAGLQPRPAQAGPDDLALLPYTSGTTGMPKGCMHSHRTLMHNAVAGAQWAHVGAETVGLAVVPMFHITGFVYGVLLPAWSGSTSVVMPRWDREHAGRAFGRYGITHFTCVPTMIIDLLASPNAASFDLSSLKFLSGGGAAMPHAVAERLQRDFGITFSEGYGLTETAAPSHGNPPERAKLQCLGMPYSSTDARVVDPETLAELPPGEIGEIVVHGPMVFLGYWQRPDATAQAFFERDGRRYFRTGDLGRVDEEGYFFITDRLKRMINASGFKVWPSEVELLMFKCPMVQEACVIAMRDDYRGESPKAIVVLKPEYRGKATAEDIIAWCREHMAAYKVPREVTFVDQLPKSGSGKVMWRHLQEQEQAAQR